MLLPIIVVEPLKIVALLVAGHGHWLSGTGILIAAYVVSLFFVERLFKVVKPKLMTLSWFATPWIWFSSWRDKIWALLRTLTGNTASGDRRRQPVRRKIDFNNP
jgi:hypothetical protein